MSNNVELKSVYCEYNQLTSLDVSKLTKLKYLECFCNHHTNLDLSKNLKLIRVADTDLMESLPTHIQLQEAKIRQIVPKSLPFIPAMTIEEANEYAENTFGIKASYIGIAVKVANEWNRGLLLTFAKFPELKKRFGFVGTTQERNKAMKAVADKKNIIRHNAWFFAEAHLSSDGIDSSFDGVTLNAIYGKDFGSLKECVLTKYNPQGCDTVLSILDHEIGHHLDYWLDVSSQLNIKKLFNLRLRKKIFEHELSIYASKNISEMIAEGWAEYCNNPTPRPLAMEIGQTIEKLYSEL
jgi:hypothetical protein